MPNAIDENSRGERTEPLLEMLSANPATDSLFPSEQRREHQIKQEERCERRIREQQRVTGHDSVVAESDGDAKRAGDGDCDGALTSGVVVANRESLRAERD